MKSNARGNGTDASVFTIVRAKMAKWEKYKEMFPDEPAYLKNKAEPYLPMLFVAGISKIGTMKGNIIKELNENGFGHEAARVSEAFAYVERAYGNKLRHDRKTKSIGHPFRIALNCAYAGADADTVIVALLHDTVEEGLCDIAGIEKKFGHSIAGSVHAITDWHKNDYRKELGALQGKRKPAMEKKIELKMKHYKLYLQDLYNSRDARALIVKLFDAFENIKSLDGERDVLKRHSITSKAMLHLPLWKSVNYDIFALAKIMLEQNCPRAMLAQVKEISGKSFAQEGYEKVGAAFINGQEPFSYCSLMQKPESYSGVPAFYMPGHMDSQKSPLLEFPDDFPKELVLKRCTDILPEFGWAETDSNPLPTHVRASNLFRGEEKKGLVASGAGDGKNMYHKFCLLGKTLHTDYLSLQSVLAEGGQ
ncbi:MAG: HD domain-containing protein [Candidatus Micrarchaeia archaeon]